MKGFFPRSSNLNLMLKAKKQYKLIGDGAKRIDLDKARLEPVENVDLKDITPEDFPQFTQWQGRSESNTRQRFWRP